MTADVWNLLKEIRVSDTYYQRGDGQATQDLDWVEATHRNWVKDIIDLSDFGYCYFTNGTTDAIHHWLMTEVPELCSEGNAHDQIQANIYEYIAEGLYEHIQEKQDKADEHNIKIIKGDSDE